jgi:DNA-binding MarR family transcriptional regulator
MPSKRRVQDTHISERLRALHGALLTIANAGNRPQVDEALIREAGIALDRALFPLLVRIERLGPIGVVDLAERAGRDYTTVSRQVAKLARLGLVARHEGAHDRRVQEAVVTAKGKAMTDALDAARERQGREIFSKWDQQDFEDLVRLVCRLAEEVERATADLRTDGRDV